MAVNVLIVLRISNLSRDLYDVYSLAIFFFVVVISLSQTKSPVTKSEMFGFISKFLLI